MKSQLVILLLFVFFSCEKEQDNLKILKGNALGTTFSIRYLDTREVAFDSKIDSLILIPKKYILKILNIEKIF